jgi:hypothetical protein
MRAGGGLGVDPTVREHLNVRHHHLLTRTRMGVWLRVVFRGHHPRFRQRAIPTLLLEHSLRFLVLETSTDQYCANHLVKQYY